VRRRITDAWARIGSLTPAAGMAAMRRGGGGDQGTAFGNPGPPDDAFADPSAAPSAKPRAKPSSNRNKALIAGAGVLAVVAVGGVVVAPRLLGGGGSSDPGCKAYAGSAITAYNKTIGDMNAQAAQSVLDADMSATITDLTGAIAQAQSASVKSALTGLLTELKSVQTDVRSGSVPTTTVNALNAASAAADSAC
jgi:hypothetical protein